LLAGKTQRELCFSSLIFFGWLANLRQRKDTTDHGMLLKPCMYHAMATRRTNTTAGGCQCFYFCSSELGQNFALQLGGATTRTGLLSSNSPDITLG
jgi:hypothetical protein